MKKLLLTSVAFLALGATSFAADLPAPAMAPVEPIASVFSWSGFYVGVHAGGAWSESDSDDGCGQFTNITGDGGGAPTFDSAEDIVDVPGDGFGGFSGGDFPEGCGEVEVSDGDPVTDTLAEAFNLDGDYVAFENDGSDGDDLEWLGGAQIGINQQYGRLVVGLEADFSWLGGGGDDEDLTFGYFHDFDGACGGDECLNDQEGTGTVSGGNDIEWLATFRGRIGGALMDEGRLLAYATGGVALAGVDNGLDADFDTDTVFPGANEVDQCDDCTFSDDDDDNDYRVGFTIGAGAEYAFNNNVSVGLQYLYVHFDDDGDNPVTFNADEGRSFDVESNDSLDSMHLVTARLNWRFGPGAP